MAMQKICGKKLELPEMELFKGKEHYYALKESFLQLFFIETLCKVNMED